MKDIYTIKQVIKDNGGIAKTADFVAEGITPYKVGKYCEEGVIEKVHHGYYIMPELMLVNDEQIIYNLIPEGVISMESALFYYGYIDFIPRKWSITVPRTISRTRLKQDNLSMKVFYVKDDIYELGLTKVDINGFELSIYDRERTICDCFKNKSKIDSELFNKAVRSYAKDEKKNLKKLATYSKKLRVSKKIFEIMEVLINE